MSSDLRAYPQQRLAMGASAATVNKDLGAWGRMFTLAIREDWVQAKPHLQRLRETPSTVEARVEQATEAVGCPTPCFMIKDGQ